MSTTLTPPRAAPPASPPPRSNGAVAVRAAKTFGRSKGPTRTAHRILIYGTGGIGKSSLAAMGPNPICADIEHSAEDLNVERVTGIEVWADLRAWLQSGDFEGIDTIIIDSATKAEEWCIAHVIANVKHEKGRPINSIEDYGFGKGKVHVFEEWRKLLSDLEQHYYKGRNIVLIGHERTGKVPNPNGEDYIRYEPRLQNGDNTSIMLATKEWCDHVLFVSYDVAATDGKAKGSGTRTIYSVEGATFMAKTRTLDGTAIVFDKGSRVMWDKLLASPEDDAPPM